MSVTVPQEQSPWDEEGVDYLRSAFSALGDRFVVWRRELRDGKPSKTPYNPNDPRKRAKASDPTTWASFDVARAVAEEKSWEMDGFGVMLGDVGDGRTLVGLDLDACLDPKTGEVADWAIEHLKRWRWTWHERSPSGGGFKAFGIYHGRLPEDHRCEITIDAPVPEGAANLGHEHPELGLYSRGRYFALTGERPKDTPHEVTEVTAAFNETLAWIEAEAKRGKPSGKAEPERGTGRRSKEEVDRSREDFALACELVREGKDDAAIEEALRAHPHGQIGTGKLVGRMADRQIRRVIEKARAAIEKGVITTKNGDPQACLANVRAYLSKDPQLIDLVGYNEMNQRIELLRDPPWRKVEGQQWEWMDRDDTSLVIYLQQHYHMMVGIDITARGVDAMARDNVFNPVKDYMEALKWDGIERLGTFASTYLLTTASVDFSNSAMKKFWVAMIARTYMPGCQVDNIPVLEGPQGYRKSSALRAIGGPWFTDRVERDVSSREEQMKLNGALVVELAELASLKRSQIEGVKAFITSRFDEYRAPYERRVIRLPRRCVLAGTVNPEADVGYLHDPTGNRRFWPIAVGRIDVDAIIRDRDQLFAEAREIFISGERWWFTPDEEEELAAPEQEAREDHDEWADIVRNWVWNERLVQHGDDGRVTGYEWSRRAQAVTVTSGAEVAEYAFHLPMKDFDRARQRRIGNALRKAGFEIDIRAKRRDETDAEKRKWWRLPKELADELKPDDAETPF